MRVRPARTAKLPVVDRLFALEGQDGILSISVIHGFQAADVYDVGTKVALRKRAILDGILLQND